MCKPSYALDPFYMSDFSDTDSDDSSVEPIDVHEIYGRSLNLLAIRVPGFHAFHPYGNETFRNLVQVSNYLKIKEAIILDCSFQPCLCSYTICFTVMFVS
jgi:hypothetical protein